MATQKRTAQEIVQAIQESKGIISVAARRLGVDRTTLYNYKKQYASVAQAIEDSREDMTDFAEGKLYEQIKEGNTTAIIFYLKTQGRNRGYVERQEVTGANGGAITFKFEWADTHDNSGHAADND